MANYIGNDHDLDCGSTTYWFEVDGNKYGVVEIGCATAFVDSNGETGDFEDYVTDFLQLAVTDEIRAQ